MTQTAPIEMGDSASAADLELQHLIIKLTEERPEWRRYLADMVVWEERNPPKADYDGFEWQDVATPTSTINQMIVAKLVRRRLHTHSTSTYRLWSLSDTKAALDATARPQDYTPIDYGDLFKPIIGHDNIKAVLTLSIRAELPVHCLLVGPAATAKSLLLSDIGRLPGAQYYVASSVTKAGLVGLLLQTRPRFLVLDELDKMPADEMAPLLNLMEGGLVTRLNHYAHDKVTLATKVFAGCNDIRRIPEAVLSRFEVMSITKYNPRQFMDVTIAVLTQREGVGPEVARLIARELSVHTTDPRSAVRVARMANGAPGLVPRIVQILYGNRRSSGERGT